MHHTLLSCAKTILYHYMSMHVCNSICISNTVRFDFIIVIDYHFVFVYGLKSVQSQIAFEIVIVFVDNRFLITLNNSLVCTHRYTKEFFR